MSGWGALSEGISAFAGDMWNLHNTHSAKVSAEDFARRRYQMMVTDLKKAGLNPMLAYMRDPGATPMQPPTPPSRFAETMVHSRATNAQTQMVEQQAAVAKSQADLNSAQAAEIRSRTYGEGKFEDLRDSEAFRNRGQGWQSDAMAAQIRRMLPSLAGKADAEKEIAELSIQHYRNMNEYEKTQFRQKLGVMSEDIQRLSNSANNISNAFNPLKVLRFLDDMTEGDDARRGGRYSQRRR